MNESPDESSRDSFVGDANQTQLWWPDDMKDSFIAVCVQQRVSRCAVIADRKDVEVAGAYREARKLIPLYKEIL